MSPQRVGNKVLRGKTKMAESDMINVEIVDHHVMAKEQLNTLVDVLQRMAPISDESDRGWTIVVCDRLNPQTILLYRIKHEPAGSTIQPSNETSPQKLPIQSLIKLIENERGQSTQVDEPTPTPSTTQSNPQLADQHFPEQDLTQREVDVLHQLVEGLTNAEISQRLGIQPSTVKHHVSSIMAKLGAASRTKAAMLAIQHSLVGLSDLSP